MTPNQLQDAIHLAPDDAALVDDETLGRVICAILGVPFGRVVPDADRYLPVLVVRLPSSALVWRSERRRAPDVDLQAATTLVRRAFPGGELRTTLKSGECYARLETARGIYHDHRGDELLCRAILGVALSERTFE